jgi:hypothetical protein
MEQKVIDFIINGIKQGAGPDQLIPALMQQFNLSQEEAMEYVSVVAEELKAQEGGQKSSQSQQKGGQQGDSSPEKVLTILEQLQIPPDGAVALIKAIFDLNEEGMQALIGVLDQALDGGGQQQAPQQQAPEGMSSDPMENI